MTSLLILIILLISTCGYAQTWDNSVGGHLTTGTSILKGSGSGGMSNATPGTDYSPSTSGSAILKGNGAGGFSNAASGTDYAPPTSGSSILKGNGAGGSTSAASGTDYVIPVDNNNHPTLQAQDFAHDGSLITEIGSDASNNVVIGNGVAGGITFSDSTVVNQGTFTAGNYSDTPVTNFSFTGGTEGCTRKWHQYTLAANPTLTLSCPTIAGNPQQTFDYLFIQPASGSTFTTFTFAATGGAIIIGDTAYVPCATNSCIDQVEVTWIPGLNNYLISIIKQNINGSGVNGVIPGLDGSAAGVAGSPDTNVAHFGNYNAPGGSGAGIGLIGGPLLTDAQATAKVVAAQKSDVETGAICATPQADTPACPHDVLNATENNYFEGVAVPDPNTYLNQINSYRSQWNTSYPYNLGGAVHRVDGACEMIHPTTAMVLQWGAAKWGMNPLLFYAEATQESDWDQAALGDVCDGIGTSSGMMQMSDRNTVDCPNHAPLAFGGIAANLGRQNTCFNVDYYAAQIWATFNGQLGPGPVTPSGDIGAAIQAWFGGVYGTTASGAYTTGVYNHITSRDWESTRFHGVAVPF